MSVPLKGEELVASSSKAQISKYYVIITQSLGVQKIRICDRTISCILYPADVALTECVRTFAFGKAR
jgi:hypothetical protein